MQKTRRKRRLIPQVMTVVFLLIASLPAAPNERRLTFALPDSVLLFGNYDELRVVTVDREQIIRPPIHQGYNGGYFATPSLSPRGDSVAWGFAVDFKKDQRTYPARFALGIHSVPQERWQTVAGDFDDIGTAAFSSDGSRIAFVARTGGKQQLLIFDVAKESWTPGPYPTGGLRVGAAMSWSLDDKYLVVEIQRGGLPYSPQMSAADADRDPVIAVIELATGQVRILGDGFNPRWSPDGEWIAYFEPGGATCVLVHPDGTGRKVAKRFKRPGFYFFAETSFVWGGPVWSPDSKQLMFTASASEPYVDVLLLDLPTARTTAKLRKSLPIYGWAEASRGKTGIGRVP